MHVSGRLSPNIAEGGKYIAGALIEGHRLRIYISKVFCEKILGN